MEKLNSKIDLIILMCFDSLIKSKISLSNPTEKSLVYFKQNFLHDFKEESSKIPKKIFNKTIYFNDLSI